MRIEWLGHAAFLLTSESGTKILTDPYESGAFGGAIRYRPITEACDVVTVSHGHADHGCTKTLPGSPKVLKGEVATSVKDARITSLASFHDDQGGRLRGENWIFVYEVEGMRLAHLGDLGAEPDPQALNALKDTDVLMIPVGGTFTLDAVQALALIKKISPRLSVPMHFKTPRLGFDIAGLEPLSRLAPETRVLKETSLSFSKETVPSGIIALTPSH